MGRFDLLSENDKKKEIDAKIECYGSTVIISDPDVDRNFDNYSRVAKKIIFQNMIETMLKIREEIEDGNPKRRREGI